MASNNPTAPPIAASSTLEQRLPYQPPARSAERGANGHPRCRPVARLSMRLPTLAQAISETMDTAPRSRSSPAGGANDLILELDHVRAHRYKVGIPFSSEAAIPLIST
jgi:hypothetical protein